MSDDQNQEPAREQAGDLSALRQLFDDYVQMYSSRDDRLTSHFSENFSGFTGGGDFLVKDKPSWVAITRQDFAQIKDPIKIEIKDVAIQSLAKTIAVATGFFAIHLPIKDHILSRETARLVLIFRKETEGWRICHSSISIPYHLVLPGEVYPLKQLTERNDDLEKVITERTTQLSEANSRLKEINGELAREIAERKLVAGALERSEERYRSILNASPDDITIADLQGRIVMVSPAAFKIFGFEPEENYLGRLVTDFIVPEDRPRALSQLAQRLHGKISGQTEYRGLRPNGTTFDIEVNSEFIRDQKGAPTGIVVIARDITERKQAEMKRKALEAQNRQLQKAESLARMAGAIAHHFNNQLQSVMMGLELVTTSLRDNSDAKEFALSAMQSARKASEVSILMLTYLGLTAAESAPLDLAKACMECLPFHQAGLPKNVRLTTDIPPVGPIVCANASRIQQVMTNLLTNAREAIGSKNGTISIAVKTQAVADIASAHRAPIDWQPQQTRYASLEIRDDGCGIADSDIEQIFDPFYSTKFTGRGMGLAVVLGITRTLDGVITVESTVGAGSVFRMYLPLAG